MSYHRKPLVFKITILVVIISALNIILYSRIIANRGDEAFDPPPQDFKSVSIQSVIIDGAGYYMSGYANILLFLHEIEWSNPESVNYDELKTPISRALDNMKKADEAYAVLEELANTIPYNPLFIEKLISFDYTTFQKVRGAEGTAFDITRKYLATGDVRGLFAHLKSGTSLIVNMLTNIKAALDSGKFPELSLLWRLNQKTSEIMLSGQFAAEIFDELGQQN